jgi:hypothetical protein
MYCHANECALYFPLISPPASDWLTRALLDWDRVGTIVPHDWVENPKLLGEHMLELVRRELSRPAPSKIQPKPVDASSGLRKFKVSPRSKHLPPGLLARSV